MKISRLAVASIVAVVCLVEGRSVEADVPPAPALPVTLPVSGPLPAESPPGVVQAWPVRVAVPGAAMLVGVPVRFDLLDGIIATGTIARRVDFEPGRFHLNGRLADGAGDFVLVQRGGMTAATVRMPDGTTWRLRPASDDGAHVMEQLDETILPGCGLDEAEPPADAIQAPAAIDASGGGGPAGDCDDGSVLDLLVVYTPAARASSGGTGAIEAIIELAVADANAAYVNSAINTQLDLVLTAEVNYDESANHLASLRSPSDGIIDGVHLLRDAFGADIVSMYVNSAGYCGIAYLLTSLNPQVSAAYAFNVNVWSCASIVLAHEIGHNEGCCHAPGDGGGCNNGGFFDYSVGYRYNGNSGTLWRTVMAYNPGSRIPHFSNPDILFDGQPTGVPDGLDPGAENARTINETAFTVANHRCPSDICDGLMDIPGDCNGNEVSDACEIAIGYSEDVNANTVPDECEPVDNDVCDRANFVFPVPAQHAITTEVALTELADDPGCGPVQRDVWVKFFAPETGYITAAVCDMPFAAGVAAYDACPEVGGQPLACTPDGCAQPIVFPVTTGLYRIRVGAATEMVGSGMLGLAFSLSPCVADIDGSGAIGTQDLLLLLADWGTDAAASDITPIGGDGVVDTNDLLSLLSEWGDCG